MTKQIKTPGKVSHPNYDVPYKMSLQTPDQSVKLWIKSDERVGVWYSKFEKLKMSLIQKILKLDIFCNENWKY